MGWQPGHKSYYSAEALAQGMDLYNQTLLKVCNQRQIDCLDLAAVIPKKTTAFYDGVHFNEHGSALVAEAIANYFLNQPPFASNQ